MRVYHPYEQTKCCALSTTVLGYGAPPFRWAEDGKTKLPWKSAPSPYLPDGSYRTGKEPDHKEYTKQSQECGGARGSIDMITLAESQRAELEPALLADGYIIVRERMFNKVDCQPFKNPDTGEMENFHSGGLVTMYIKETFPHMNYTSPDFPHDKYVLENNRIRSRRAIEESKRPGKSHFYGMTTR